MKKYKGNISTIIMTVIVIFIAGCDDYLAEKEVPRLSVEYYGTPEGADAAAVAAYSYMRFGVGGENANVFNELGNDLTTGAVGAVGYPTNIYDNALSPSTTTRLALYLFWQNHYKAINTTNIVVGELPKNEKLTEAEKNAALAEMYFLRAYFYFDLVQQFGKIPLVLEADYAVRTSFQRAPVADIYRAMIGDLRFAAEHLREKTSASEKNIGKATRYAAAHLLSKVYLARCSAVTEQRGQQPTDADSALYYARMVIESPNYKLLDNFSSLWDPNNQGHSEVVFSVQFSTDPIYNATTGSSYTGLDDGNKLHLYWCAMYENLPGLVRDVENGRPYRFHRVTNRTMFDLYDRKNDSRFYKSFKWVWYCNRAVAPSRTNPFGLNVGDTALYHSLNPKPDDATYAYTYIQWNRDNISAINDYYPQLIKFIEPNRTTVNAQGGVREWVRMRLGETYLLAAEAAGRTGNFTAAAEYFNVVRQRAAWHDGEAKMSQYWREEGGEYGNTSSTYNEIKVEASYLSSLTADQFVDFVLDERGRELLGECMRWEDLVRCEKLYEYVKTRGYNPEATYIQPYHKLRPIPQQHIDRLIPAGVVAEEQNEGYY
ncbi:MAG: RagB/SusD family nutrient uptake outer membrane protein [Dysgonamonadaceae bacterium]|jgi:hypothetical protein|nr:RagB/SusD family nutrient uptake outer membrane protein [Dysgonamonadaceae bacterium]